MVFTVFVISLIYVNATKIDYPWYFDSLNILENRKYGKKNEIGIAIIDSGFNNACQKYLRNKVIQYDVTEEDNTFDSTGHGTNMALLMGANSETKGSIYGINPYIQIYSIKVSNSLGFTNSTYLHKALDFCKSLNISIINIGLGGVTHNKAIENDINELKKKNIFVVCASGDKKTNFLYPADYASSYCVVSQNSDSTIFTDSNLLSTIGKKPIIVPGTEIDVLTFGLKKHDIYLTKRSGSSYATAIFSGYLSLYLAKNDCNVTPATLDGLLENNLYTNGFLSIL